MKTKRPVKGAGTTLLVANCCLVFAATSALADPVKDLIETRKHIKPFYATYHEQIRLFQPVTAEPGAHLGWGASDSDLDIEAAIDAHCSKVSYASMVPKAVMDKSPMGKYTAGGAETFANADGITYSLIEGGARGAFGRRADGKLNPAAECYEPDSARPSDFFSRGKYSVTGPLTIDLSYGNRNSVISFRTRNGQTTIQSIEDTHSGEFNRTSTRVLDWVERSGSSYPKTILQQLYKNGAIWEERTWTLKKIHEGMSQPVKVELQNGALIRDDDTNIVYDVKNGKLVPDPIFNREVAHQTTIRRLLFLLAIGVLTVWILLFLRSRSRRKLVPSL